MSAPPDLRATVLITNYNYGRFLGYAVESALEQTWPNVQVIVVDDGSTDESRLLLQTYGDAIQTVFKENGGQASSVNAGFSLVEGDAVILLDSDDMLDPTAIEKTIGFFADPEVIKVSWPMAIVDDTGYPTGEIRFPTIPAGNFRRNALKVGPASHSTPPASANFWRTSFLQAVLPVPEADFRNVVDAYLFTFSPFFGSFQSHEDPLTFYRMHGENYTTRYTARPRLEDWERRAKHLHAWLTAQGEDVSIERWRRHNLYYRRLKGILQSEQKVGRYLPPRAPLVLVAGRFYDRADIRPLRPVYRPPDNLRSPERTEADFRAFIDQERALGLPFLALQGSATWAGTNFGVFAELLRTEHKVLYEDKWILLAEFARVPGA